MKVKKDSFEELLARVFLFLLGGFFLVLPIIVLYREASTSSIWGYLVAEASTSSIWGFLVVVVFMMLGCLLLFVALMGSKKTVRRWAANSGHHEIEALFFLLAVGISYVIRRIRKLKKKPF